MGAKANTMIPTTLYDLLHQCSVKLLLSDGTRGTGFFVAPGYLLTCEHVVRNHGGFPIQVSWQQQDNFAEAHIEEILEEYDIALLHFVPPSDDLPCVYLSDELKVGDEIYLFGYPDTEYENGRPVTPEFEGFTGDAPPFMLLEKGQLQPGMSGAALLNRRTGKVCGMAKFTRDQFTDLGGGGITSAVIFQQLPKLVKLQQEFHQQDQRWQKFFNQDTPSKEQAICPNNLPRSGTVRFLGRENELTALHTRLHQIDELTITAIQGMGGIGKTELALQYARYHLKQLTYGSGICWLQAKKLDVGTEIVNFAQTQLGLTPPNNLNLLEQVQFCWRNWPIQGDVLIIVDDVADYAAIKLYLPPQEPHFKVLVTTRLQLGASIQMIHIEVLSEDISLKLIESLISSERLAQELTVAKALCRWLGYLPLGLELVGRFLSRKPDWTLEKMQQQLKSKRLQARALNKRQADMTAIHESAAAAFELSWQTLSKEEQHLAYRLSLFALAPIPWDLVEAWSGEDEDDLEDWRDDGLLNRSLLTRVGQGTYQLHQLIREYFRSKLDDWPKADNLKRSFSQKITQISKQIPQTPNREQILEITPTIPHLTEVTTTWLDSLSNESLICAFVGLGKFYEGQGFYREAKTWYEKCTQVIKQKSRENLSLLASIQGHLARIHQLQGQYNESEKLYKQVLKIQEKSFQISSPEIAETLNDLGVTLYKQGKYSEAEPLFSQAVQLRKTAYGDVHSKVVEGQNNLAGLYNAQGRYDEAEKIIY
ncbi:tetratricopeptide repeat protein [Acaryochloris sp. 'Moss Beach']|uniref:tetratricopeptide repeat protein n=1 Tax=Acaryochloris sp. 'Moss Beach' TaxID=2740837 RepID=UPI001F31EBC6|nr:tetratricopeptide repeat protein [Acaryochloris sp. 'Moss Beach']UJB70620.1 tetratricopeptide repeat protein [Acaryochloris sp. 'Moss Beach']